MAAVLLVALLLAAAGRARAWQTGFDHAGTCSNVRPDSLVGAPQTSDVYSINLNPSDGYVSGESVGGTMQGPAYRGFKLQAQFASPTTTSPSPNGAVGNFATGGLSFISVKSVACTLGSFLTNGAIISTDRYTFNWIAPTTATNEVAFFATIVQDSNTYWEVRSQGITRRKVWGDWTAWGDCSETCGYGNRQRQRTCLQFCSPVGETETETSSCINTFCPGEWNPWSQWSTCSRTCGPTGVRTRVRSCPDTLCQGDTNDEEECFEGNCPVQWNPWSPWTACDPTCGAGATRVRTRTCPGTTCGSGPSTETQNCATISCPSGQLSQWSAWDTCSRTCGGGMQTRTRFCIRQPCTGPFTDSQGCNTFACGGGNQGSWGPWSSCSVPCGLGTARRTWICPSGTSCPGFGTESRPCSGQQCSGVWLPWGEWGECSQPCGGGSRSRSRVCPSGSCSGSSVQPDGIICNAHACTDGWSAWSAWSPCSVSCGDGYTLRQRFCQRGSCADGSATETKPCSLPYCQNTWSLWGDWGECSASCGGGERWRKRYCVVADCPAPDQRDRDALPCNNFPCPQVVWGEWMAWSECSRTCGGGYRERSRYCYSDNCPHYGDKEQSACAINDCKDDTPLCHPDRPHTQEGGVVPICHSGGFKCPLGFVCVLNPTTDLGVCCPDPLSCPRPLVWHNCKKGCVDNCDYPMDYCPTSCRRGCFCPDGNPYRSKDKCVRECPKPPKPLPDVTCMYGKPRPGTCYSNTCQAGDYCEINKGEKVGRCCQGVVVIEPSSGVRPRPEVFGVLLTLVLAALNALL